MQQAVAQRLRVMASMPKESLGTSDAETHLLSMKHGILVLSGYGLRVAVERGQLVISDGIGRDRREGCFSRATCGLKRLVILGHSGTVSLEALRWLYDLGASVSQIDADGNVLLASGPPRTDDVRLRRAQAIAPWAGAALDIARTLLSRKLEGQAQVLAHLSDVDEAIAVIHQASADLEHADAPERLRLIEAQAAAAYWQAWAALPVRFSRKDERAVPDHWRTFGSRTSPLTDSPRRAANPANAVLNYLYAILEAEARIALLAVGLDPGMGLLHADQRNRDSLACDLMEVVRPAVDAAALELLQTQTFTAKDFFETRQGDCRLLSPMTQVLAETAPRWAKLVAPIAEELARMLLDAFTEGVMRIESSMQQIQDSKAKTAKRAPTHVQSQKQSPLATPLTQANRSAGREHQRKQSVKSSAASTERASVLAPTCRTCGAPLADAEHTYCVPCRAERHAELYPTFIASGLETLAELRAAGEDPAHGGTAAKKRGTRLLEQARANQEWEATRTRERKDGADTSDGSIDFARDVLPGLQSVQLATMMQVTGLSRRHCWRIRRGDIVPHPRHWEALQRL